MKLSIDRTSPLSREMINNVLHMHPNTWEIAEQDGRALRIDELNLQALTFENFMLKGESSIASHVKLSRLTASKLIPLDFMAAISLIQDSQSLKWLEAKEITYLDFLGTVLKTTDGHNRGVVALNRRDDGSWYLTLVDLFFHFWPESLSACTE